MSKDTTTPAKVKRAISVVDRRLQSGAIFRAGSEPIPLREPGRWTLRVVNADIHSQHVHQLRMKKGWEYAEPGDLAVAPEDVGFRLENGRLVCGAHGAEVLMKMPAFDFQRVQVAKDREVRRQTFGSQALKDSVLAAAGREPGGAEGADFLQKQLHNISVTDSREALDPTE